MKRLLTIILTICSVRAFAQSSPQAIHEWQQHYKQDFLSDPRSPLKATDTGFLRFFPYDAQHAYRAKVRRVRKADTISMTTHSGKIKKYRTYAILRFSQRQSVAGYPWLRTEPPHVKLYLYQSIDLARDTTYKDYLFLPFNDLTNGAQTFGGGRYLDFKKGDIKHHRLLLDFNKAYNPYCAFGEGYSCPIPPVENRLKDSVMAGEMMPAPPLRKSE